jgi:branched-chain amino acid transport system ATP-binding protein
MSDLVLDQPLRPLLELVDLARDRGGAAGAPPLGPLTCALDNASISGLIGLGGAGRSALLALLTGQLTPTAGSLRFDGLRIDHMDPTVRARLGIIAMNRDRLVPSGTLLDMLVLARAAIARPPWRLLFGLGTGPGPNDREDLDAILNFLDIGHLAARPVASLGGLEARLGELARCLVQRPRLLLLDRPLGGLDADDRTTLARCLGRLRKAELTLVIVEDDLATLGRIADRCLVLHRGRLVADATPAVIGASSPVFRLLTGSAL